MSFNDKVPRSALISSSSTPTKSGVENLAFDRNTDSLFEELSSAGNDLIGDVDEGADLLGKRLLIFSTVSTFTNLLVAISYRLNCLFFFIHCRALSNVQMSFLVCINKFPQIFVLCS